MPKEYSSSGVVSIEVEPSTFNATDRNAVALQYLELVSVHSPASVGGIIALCGSCPISQGLLCVNLRRLCVR